MKQLLRFLLGKMFPKHYTYFPQHNGPYTVGNLLLFLDFSNRTHRRIYKNQGFELAVTNIFLNMLLPQDIVVDIGANFGWYSLSALTHNPEIWKCYAYEPLPSTFTVLKKNVMANRCETRCKIEQIAIGERLHTTILKEFEDATDMNSSLFGLGDLSYTEWQVRVFPLDDLVSDYPRVPAIIKCDVEGGERDVLLGAKRLMSGEFGTPPVWLLEANYETSAMAGYFPWDLISVAQQYAAYEPYYIRNQSLVALSNRKSLRHGDTLILAIPSLHRERLSMVSKST